MSGHGAGVGDRPAGQHPGQGFLAGQPGLGRGTGPPLVARRRGRVASPPPRSRRNPSRTGVRAAGRATVPTRLPSPSRFAAESGGRITPGPLPGPARPHRARRIREGERRPVRSKGDQPIPQRDGRLPAASPKQGERRAVPGCALPPPVPPRRDAEPEVRRRPPQGRRRGAAPSWAGPTTGCPLASRALTPTERRGAPGVFPTLRVPPSARRGSAPHQPRTGSAGPPRIPLGNALGSWRRQRPSRRARLSLAASPRPATLESVGSWPLANVEPQANTRGPLAGAAQADRRVPQRSRPMRQAGPGGAAAGQTRPAAAQSLATSAEASWRTSVGAKGSGRPRRSALPPSGGEASTQPAAPLP